MSAQNGPSVDDFEVVEPAGRDDDDDDVPTISLDAGQQFVGQVRHVEPDKGYHGLLHLTLDDGRLATYWRNGTVKSRMKEAGVQPGDWLLVRKTEEVRSFTDDDGEEQSYHVHEVGVIN